MHKVLEKFESGQLRQVVTLQDPPSGTGTRGERTGTWSDVATLRARIETLSGNEIIEAHQLAGICTHRVTIRHRSGLDITQRFKFGDKAVNIVFINNVEELNRVCFVLCKQDV